MARRRAVYACDVGSTRSSKPTFAWVRLDSTKIQNRITAYSSIEKLLEKLRQDVHESRDIALGFEAPLFIPVPSNASDLSRGRMGERDRPFSSQVGLAVTTLAVHQSVWILMKLRECASGRYMFTTDAGAWPLRVRPSTCSAGRRLSPGPHIAEYTGEMLLQPQYISVKMKLISLL